MYINIIINIFSQHDRPRFSDWKDVKFESKFGQVYSNWVAGMSDNSTNRSKAPQTDEVGIRAEGERKYIALIFSLFASAWWRLQESGQFALF